MSDTVVGWANLVNKTIHHLAVISLFFSPFIGLSFRIFFGIGLLHDLYLPIVVRIELQVADTFPSSIKQN